MISLNKSYALPIDWHGVFAVDTTLIDTFRRFEGTSGAGIGPQNINDPLGSFENASFQSYKLQLSPSIIINDSITFNGQLTTGYGYGGRLGDSNLNQRGNNSFGNALYFHNTTTSDSNVILTQFYAEIFSDTGTFLLGRQPYNWGLGAVFNNGNNIWDRHATIKDGLVAQFKLSNFQIAPYYFKTSSGATLTKATNSKEIGLTLLYDNPEKDLTFGVLFGKKENSANSTDLQSAVSGTQGLGSTDVTITDVYLKKSFSRLTLEAEVPLFSGDVGSALTANTNAKFKAIGLIGKSSYALSDSWTFGLDLGSLSGDDGPSSDYEAIFLHPNFQVANLMFRYNLNAIASGDQNSIFDSYMTNARYAKFHTTYHRGSWKWDLAFIWAKASETAQAGSAFYDQDTNTLQPGASIVEDQSDDYGFEIDLNFTYAWNDNFTLGGSLGYHFVGDFYEFDNIDNSTSTPVEIKNSFGAILNAAISF